MAKVYELDAIEELEHRLEVARSEIQGALNLLSDYRAWERARGLTEWKGEKVDDRKG